VHLQILYDFPSSPIAMAKPIDNACEDEPPALPFKTGGPLRRNQEYLIFYFLTASALGLEIASACLGSLYGAQSHYFIATVSPFLATHWYAPSFVIPRSKQAPF
jgi:hypothetical protein